MSILIILALLQAEAVLEKVEWGEARVEVVGDSIQGTAVEVESLLELPSGPVNDVLTVSFAYSFGEEARIELFDVLGRRVVETRFEGPRGVLDVSHLARGVYFVLIQVGSGKPLARRVIVR